PTRRGGRSVGVFSSAGATNRASVFFVRPSSSPSCAGSCTKMSLNTFKHQSAQADPFLRARKCDKAPPPGMKIYPRRGWITFFELVTFFELWDSSPPGDARPDYLHPIRPAERNVGVLLDRAVSDVEVHR